MMMMMMVMMMMMSPSCPPAVNITVDTDGLIQAAGRGWRAAGGPSPGLPHDSGGSGGSHGGLGGTGTSTLHAQGAYDSTRLPRGAGSGGSVVSAGFVLCRH